LAIVIDEDSWADLLKQNTDYPILHNWLFDKRKIKVGVCDYLIFKLENMGSYLNLFRELESHNQIVVAEENKVQIEIPKIINICISDDIIILAMMRVGRFRLILTCDEDLMKDVKNHRILNRPRGKVYKEVSRQSAESLIRNNL